MAPSLPTSPDSFPRIKVLKHRTLADFRPPTVEDGDQLQEGSRWLEYSPDMTLRRMWSWEGDDWCEVRVSRQPIPIVDVGAGTIHNLGESRHERALRAAYEVPRDRMIETYLRVLHDLPGSSAGRPVSEGGDVGLEGGEDAQDTSDGVAVGEGVGGDDVGRGPAATKDVLTAVGELLQVLGEHLVGEGAAGVVGHRSSSRGSGDTDAPPGSATVEQEGGSCPACDASSSRGAGQARAAGGES